VIRIAPIFGNEAAVKPALERVPGAVLAPADACDAAFIQAAPNACARAERCLGEGRHVLLVAPACPSLAALDQLLDAQAASGARLAILNPERFLPSRQLIRSQIEAGKLGEIGLVRLVRLSGNEGPDSAAPASWQPELDLVLWLASREAETLYATPSGTNRGVQIHLGFHGGAMGTIAFAQGCGHDFRCLTVIGSRGAAYDDDQSNHQLRFHARGAAALPTRCTDSEPLAKANMLRHFAETIAGRGDFTADIRGWRRTLELARAVEQSLAGRQAVRIGGPQP
jgi:predicted dehydrogenase